MGELEYFLSFDFAYLQGVGIILCVSLCQNAEARLRFSCGGEQIIQCDKQCDRQREEQRVTNSAVVLGVSFYDILCWGNSFPQYWLLARLGLFLRRKNGRVEMQPISMVSKVISLQLSGQPVTVTCAGLSSSLVLIVVFLVVRDRSEQKVSPQNHLTMVIILSPHPAPPRRLPFYN